MANGVEISQQGIGVDQALDSQKVLDTRWRYFEIYKEIEISIGDIPSGGSYTLYEHNLGFVPFFECYNITQGAYMSDFVNFNGPSLAQWTILGGLVADNKKIYFWGTLEGSYSNTKVLLRVYNVNAMDEYTAPIVAVGPKQISKTSSYGAKVTNRQEADALRDPELSHYTMNTKGKALAIQKVGTILSDTTTGFQATIDHNLGSPPIYLMAYMKPDKSYIGALNPSFVPVIGISTNTTMKFNGAQAALIGAFSYVIFKEFADFAI